MTQDLESGKKIIELYEKKIESQSNFSIAFFGAMILLVTSHFTKTGTQLDLQCEWILWICFAGFGATIIVGYWARMSLIACVPIMINLDWGSEDASGKSYNGKEVLEGLMVVQVLAFLTALISSSIFISLNVRVFVA